ncbi:tripartite tricarboxylate transporter substrate binding protein [Bradyrhizobium sp. S69]|uniref:Bug family tripartite tricarboxylate transporter substrate binding protein n=1 Tax=Bradyrhizobium sp. S69 TaxID=1641856 RepID=UPI001AEEC0D2|nr:tripartite tricarboxylate transporter substrate binding protein [Bradyrhizobium sp. S69]
MTRLITRPIRIAARIAVGVASVLMLGAIDAAAGDYPDHPIRLLVPGAAGGGMDAVARMVANTIGETLKQPVVVENKPGAAGNIAVNQLAKSAPDGYTMVLGQTSQLAINPSLYGNLPYDPIKDFVPVLLLADAPNVVVVPASSPYRSLADVVAAAKKMPDGMDFATPGIGTVSHLTAELFARSAGIKLRHIPSRGANTALLDVAAGRIPLMLSSIPTALGLIRSGELRAIAVSALARTPVLPDVPTVAEQGYPGFNAGTWYGLLVPAGTPAAIVKRLNEAGNAALKLPAIVAQVQAEGGVVLGGSSAAFTDKLEIDNSKWSKLIKEAGLHLD